jgi:hypothetical protein
VVDRGVRLIVSVIVKLFGAVISRCSALTIPPP